MKRSLLSLVILTLFLFASIRPFQAKASHGAGGELTYEWVVDSTYRFHFRYFSDCSGIPEPTDAILCLYSFVHNITYNLTLLKTGVNNGAIVPVFCKNTKCDDPTSSIPGFKEWHYTALFTLPYQDDWRIGIQSVNGIERNVSVNIFGGAFGLETRLNNVGSLQGNSSPYFTQKAIQYYSINQMKTFNNGVIDPDGDSLVTDVIPPMDGTVECNPSANLSFLPTSPSYNILNNPIQTNNTFTFQNTTGQMQFVPTMLGSATMAIRVKEYRNGVQIGSVSRDIQLQILPNTGTVPSLSLLPGGNIKNGVVNGCPGKQLSFCVRGISPNSYAVLKMHDDHTSVLPGASVSYSGVFTDTVKGCFTWTPPPFVNGTYSLTVVVTDSICTGGGLAPYTTLTIPIHINGNPPAITIKAVPDTNILSGASVTFITSVINCGSGSCQWQKNGVDVAGQTSSSWTTSGLSDMDIISCKLHCTDTCITASDVVSNQLRIHVFTNIKGTSAIKAAILYPNPNNGIFTLKGYAVKETGMTIEVLNAIGQVVYHHYETVKAGTILKTITLDNVNSGIYLLRIKTNDGVDVKEFTINR